MYLLEALNPIGRQRGLMNSLTISPRPDTLDNKTVGLLWSGTHGGDLALNRAGEMIPRAIRQRRDQVLHRRQLPCSAADSPAAARECDVVIGATAD